MPPRITSKRYIASARRLYSPDAPPAAKQARPLLHAVRRPRVRRDAALSRAWAGTDSEGACGAQERANLLVRLGDGDAPRGGNASIRLSSVTEAPLPYRYPHSLICHSNRGRVAVYEQMLHAMSRCRAYAYSHIEGHASQAARRWSLKISITPGGVHPLETQNIENIFLRLGIERPRIIAPRAAPNE